MLAAHPWLAQLKRGVVKSDTDRHDQAMSEIVGDPLPLGIAPKRPAIEPPIQYSYQQGLLPEPYSIDDLFVDPQAA